MANLFKNGDILVGRSCRPARPDVCSTTGPRTCSYLLADVAPGGTNTVEGTVSEPVGATSGCCTLADRHGVLGHGRDVLWQKALVNRPESCLHRLAMRMSAA